MSPDTLAAFTVERKHVPGGVVSRVSYLIKSSA